LMINQANQRILQLQQSENSRATEIRNQYQNDIDLSEKNCAQIMGSARAAANAAGMIGSSMYDGYLQSQQENCDAGKQRIANSRDLLINQSNASYENQIDKWRMVLAYAEDALPHARALDRFYEDLQNLSSIQVPASVTTSNTPVAKNENQGTSHSGYFPMPTSECAGLLKVGTQCMSKEAYCNAQKPHSYYSLGSLSCQCEKGFHEDSGSSTCQPDVEPVKQCPSGLRFDINGTNCVSYDEYCAASSGIGSKYDAASNTCQMPKKQEKQQSKYFVGTPKSKQDLLNCTIVGNKSTRLYYLRGSLYIKSATHVGKICMADEAAAKKAGYRKSKQSKL
jgi:hypothetical protein